VPAHVSSHTGQYAPSKLAPLTSISPLVHTQAYQREYGFTLDRPILVDDLRVRSAGHSNALPQGSEDGAAGACPCVFYVHLCVYLPAIYFLHSDVSIIVLKVWFVESLY